MSKETVAADDRQRGFLKRLFKWQTTGAVSAVTEEVDGHGHPEESLFISDFEVSGPIAWRVGFARRRVDGRLDGRRLF